MLRAYGGEAGVLPPDQFAAYLADPRIKNGFLMAILEFGKLNGQLEAMKALCEGLIAEIDAELAAGA